MECQIRQYSLHQGALEIEYIEEYVGEFERPKRAAKGGRTAGKPRPPYFYGRGEITR